MNHNDHAYSARCWQGFWVWPGKRSSRTGGLLRDFGTSDRLVVYHVASYEPYAVTLSQDNAIYGNLCGSRQSSS